MITHQSRSIWSSKVTVYIVFAVVIIALRVFSDVDFPIVRVGFALLAIAAVVAVYRNNSNDDYTE